MGKSGRWQARRSGKYLSPGVFKSATGNMWRVQETQRGFEKEAIVEAGSAQEAIAKSGFRPTWAYAYAVEWKEGAG